MLYQTPIEVKNIRLPKVILETLRKRNDDRSVSLVTGL